MKKLLPIIAIVFVLLFTLTACAKVTVYDAVMQIGVGAGGPFDNSDKYDLDERFDYFQMLQVGGDSTLHLKATTGIVSYYFTTEQNADGSLACTLTGIYVYDVGNSAFGPIEGDRVADFVDKLTFTLVLEDNVVTSHDLPQLIVE